MPAHFIARKLAVWLMVAAALQCPAYGFGTKSKVAGSLPVAQTLASLPPVAKQRLSREPFGEISIPVTAGDMPGNWRLIQSEIDAEAAILDRCRTQRECPKAARAFFDIVAQGRGHDGLARIGLINRAVNLAIIPTSDMKQWGVEDHWSPPLETLATGRGDCEDYAIVKYVALIDAGVAKEDVRLVIVHNRLRHEDHAVAAARVDGVWRILDDRSFALVPDAEMRGAIPLFVMDDTGTKILVPEVASGGIS